jgi:hypothetical protein
METEGLGTRCACECLSKPNSPPPLLIKEFVIISLNVIDKKYGKYLRKITAFITSKMQKMSSDFIFTWLILNAGSLLHKIQAADT